ncbi:hypothetical protein [Aeromonas salmonicida]|uniref:hypothetical protein n=1 Tax=Aeromonas salmonicida TaxID=645 RepID=UPI003D223449
MNLTFSYTVEDDSRLTNDGCTFLGAGRDIHGVETHVFLRAGMKLGGSEEITDENE